ncbi:MAG: prepilin-type N-terminal cleavage/methylation domain-containing protein [bacterium]|nr:prepilin-type N-terminal cleavage/methylation domain-containing protein [bacterium]
MTVKPPTANQQPPTRSAGFTLVELLVSVGLFAVIMTISAGAYLVMVGVNARAQAIALTTDNLAFVLENITRSIRTGTNYSCGGSNCSAGESFSFTDQNTQDITYTFVHASGSVNGHIQATIGSAAPVQLTDSAVDITSLKFYLSGYGGTSDLDYAQPFVRIVATGTARADKGQTVTFSVETAAAMRGIDL